MVTTSPCDIQTASSGGSLVKSPTASSTVTDAWPYSRRSAGATPPLIPGNGVGGVLILIVVSAGVSMLNPFLIRDALDKGLLGRDTTLLTLYVLGMIGVAFFTNAAGVWQRLHEVLLADLRAAGALDLSRAVIDGSHIRAVKGGPKPVRVRSTARGRARNTTSFATRRGSRSRPA